MTGTPRLTALVANGRGLLAVHDGHSGRAGRLADAGNLLRGEQERVVVWSARRDLHGLVAAHAPPPRVLDLAEGHRLLFGGWAAGPDEVWAARHDLPREGIPPDTPDDLFAVLVGPTAEEELVTAGGYLRPDAVAGRWQSTPERLIRWAGAAYECGVRTRTALERLGSRAVSAAVSESSAAVLCLELERDGLPIDRPAVEELIAASAGRRPRDEREAQEIRASRDAEVLRHAPGHEGVDLRNPAAVKELLLAIGLDVPSTRKWVLEPYREAHPLVGALLAWRADERIATTYGFGWLERHVGADDRLRGAWTACDGAAGRMTAQNGLHNLPTALRPGVAAAPGWVFVRADLGQIEPRVLACVAQDHAFAAATQSDDLYAPVAARLGIDRSRAKVAVLAAMYGQRSGAAGEALAGLQRAYPIAMAFLDRAYESGVAGADLRTFGGRLIRTAGPHDAGSRGRYARNALIQGAAAELFKAWAATVRVTTADLGAEVVLCLHDELLVHTPEAAAEECAARVGQALTDAARRWSGAAPVRFVTDTRIIRRWSEAK